MNEIETINAILNQIYSEPIFSMVKCKVTVEKANTILLRLHNEGLADITISEPLPGMKKTFFSISSKARQLIETLPEEYENKPYSYLLKLEADEKLKEQARKVLEEKQMQSVLDTNENVKATNYFTKLNVATSMVFSIMILIIQVKSCNLVTEINCETFKKNIG